MMLDILTKQKINLACIVAIIFIFYAVIVVFHNYHLKPNILLVKYKRI